MGLSRSGGVWITLQQLLKGGRHLRVFLELSKSERLLKECYFHLLAELKSSDDLLEIGKRLGVALSFLPGKATLEDGSGGEFVAGIFLCKCRVGTNGSCAVTRGIECPSELVERGGALLWLKRGIFYERRVGFRSGRVVGFLK